MKSTLAQMTVGWAGAWLAAEGALAAGWLEERCGSIGAHG